MNRDVIFMKAEIFKLGINYLYYLNLISHVEYTKLNLNEGQISDILLIQTPKTSEISSKEKFPFWGRLCIWR